MGQIIHGQSRACGANFEHLSSGRGKTEIATSGNAPAAVSFQDQHGLGGGQDVVCPATGPAGVVGLIKGFYISGKSGMKKPALEISVRIIIAISWDDSYVGRKRSGSQHGLDRRGGPRREHSK